MTLEWILSEIKDMESAPNTAKSVYDLAMLLIVRDHLQPLPSSAHDNEQAAPAAPIVSATPDALTIDMVDEALSRVHINSPEDKQRAEDLRTWLQILRPEG